MLGFGIAKLFQFGTEFEKLTICQSNRFGPLEYQTCLIFKPPRYYIFADADEMLVRRPFVVPRALGGCGGGGGGGGGQDESSDEEEEIEANGKKRFDIGRVLLL